MTFVTQIDPRGFRDALGRFATGVVLVTADTSAGSAGLAVNSFTSVSLDPPLVAFCPARTSASWPLIRQAGGFAVSILALEHGDLCQRFATRGADRFASAEWGRSPNGHPVASGCLAWLDCTIEQVHPAGDHDIVVGRVGELGICAGDPLVFYSGTYARLETACRT